MKKTLVILIVIFSGYLPTAQADTLLREGHPDRYVVKKGDTLWDISAMFLEDPWLWPEIWEINPEVENPHLIYPGDVILLIYRGGKPRIVIVPPDGGKPVLDQDDLEKPRRLPPSPKPPSPTDFTSKFKSDPKVWVDDRVVIADSRTDKLRPQIRARPLASAIPAIPLDAIAGMLTKGRIVDRKVLEDAPYVLSGLDINLIFGPGDLFYARGDRETWKSNTVVYGVFKEDAEVFRDPVTGKVLGIEAREAGLARLERSVNDIATFHLISVSEDIRLNDRLLPTEERRLESTFFPRAPRTEIRASIMKILGGVGMSTIGMYDAIAINKGEEDGLETGDILEVFRKGDRVKDPNRYGTVKLPPERSGIIMVYRVFEKMSYALVLQAGIPLTLGDLALSP